MSKILSLLAAVLMFGACSGQEQNSFVGKEYKLTQAPNNAEITLGFDGKENRYFGKAAVNNYFGAYTLEGENLSSDFEKEEEVLLDEFESVSGVTEIYNSDTISTNISGVVLELMLQQDELRLKTSTDEIKHCVKMISQFILRLYKQFALIPRLARIVGDRGEVEMFYFNSSDISSDDIELETENELGESLTSRREMVFDLLNAGILQDEDGKISTRMKVKVLELLGLGIWENAQDQNELHLKKADNENLAMLSGKDAKVLEIDQHSLHIDRHIAFMLSGDYEEKSLLDPTLEERFLQHIRQHNKLLKEEDNG